MRPSRRGQGFTLLELMILVVVLALLAAVALPAYSRLTKRGKTSEALGNIQRIYTGQLVYYERSTSEGSGNRFLNQPFFTPDNNPGSGKYPTNSSLWSSDPQWSALNFSIPTPHYYAYNSFASGVGPGVAYFYGRAIGDLDGDDVNSTFTVRGDLTDLGVERSAVDVVRELE
ncbi:MAG: prepilin-type N-terminal cleavage/methylation domain-containing protein [Deltaproteobacteria bacterium]|nr:prepilin-type N-terminal cleavage/methylation domain-containing protein [Deltaproteobacteria bacterium]